jgi:hypothetical protein
MSKLTYATNTHFGPVSPAVKMVRDHIVWEAEIAVKPTSGYMSLSNHNQTSRRAEWADIGATTVPQVANIIKHIRLSPGIR